MFEPSPGWWLTQTRIVAGWYFLSCFSVSDFPSLGCPPGPCHYRESTLDSRGSPTGRASPSGLCSLMRFSDCFPSFMKRQAHRAGVGTCSAARASFGSDGGRPLSCLLGCWSLRPGWLASPISLACVISHRLAPGCSMLWQPPSHIARRALARPA